MQINNRLKTNTQFKQTRTLTYNLPQWLDWINKQSKTANVVEMYMTASKNKCLSSKENNSRCVCLN